MSYDTLASKNSISTITAALTERGYLPESVETAADALARIKALIPANASVMNGTSQTLEQIGYIDYLKAGKHGWNNLHEAILAEKDPVKQAKLRTESSISDFYLGSVHAIAETGEIVIASNTGSQLPHIVYTSPNVILVVSTQKIVKNLEEATDRLKTHVVPLEDVRMKKAYGFGTSLSKILILNKEPAFNKRNIHIIFVNEKLGF